MNNLNPHEKELERYAEVSRKDQFDQRHKGIRLGTFGKKDKESRFYSMTFKNKCKQI